MVDAIRFDDHRLGGNFVNQNSPRAENISNFADMLRSTAATGRTVESAPAQPASAAPAPAESSRFAVIDREGRLFEQCVELEIFMVKTLISSMRNTIQKSSLIDEGMAGKMYEDMLYDEYARSFATNANFGMAELAYLELTGQRGKVVR